MTDDAADQAERTQPRAFLSAYALAWSAGAIAYIPFLTTFLPIRFSEVAGVDDVRWLGISAAIGAVGASIGNILWGWASDRFGRRLQWSAAGFVGIALSFALMVRATDPAMLVACVFVWQLALNMFLAPMAAYAADSVPDRQKGRLGGMLAVAPALAAISVVAVAVVPDRFDLRLLTVVALIALFAAPLFLMRRAQPLGRIEARVVEKAARRTRGTLVSLWVARLTVQAAESILFAFLYYFLRSLADGELSLARFAATNAVVQLVSIPLALKVGQLSDRHGRRKLPLLSMIGSLVLGLIAMSIADDWVTALIAYGFVVVGSNVFLALHSAFLMQQLPQPSRYGRDLGIFNLTNTLPSIVTPLFAVTMIATFGYSTLLVVLAISMIVPTILIARLKLS